MTDYFRGPFRQELRDGTLVYLDWDGSEEYRCPRQHPDMPLAAEREDGRWWRNHPLARGVLFSVEAGMPMSSVASDHNITVALAYEIAEKLVEEGSLHGESFRASLLKDLRRDLRSTVALGREAGRLTVSTTASPTACEKPVCGDQTLTTVTL